jgi:ribonuclease HI
MLMQEPSPLFPSEQDTPLATWRAWCDGTACPNPGRIGLGAVLLAPDGREFPLSEASVHHGCNNEAEARALLATLELALSLGALRLRVHSDSDVIVRLAQDAHTTEAVRLAPLLAQLRERLGCFEWVELKWLPQHRNQVADHLARQAIGLPPRQPPKPTRRRR